MLYPNLTSYLTSVGTLYIITKLSVLALVVVLTVITGIHRHKSLKTTQD